MSEQSLRDLGGRWSILDRQKLDHIKLDGLLESLERTEGAEQRRVSLRVHRLVLPLSGDSTLLARTAHVIELLPIIRRGEDPSAARGNTAA